MSFGPISVAGFAAASGGGGSFATFSHTASPAVQAAPGSTTVTFSSVAIGTAASNRVVVVMSTTSGFVVNSMTIGGVSATKAVNEATVTSDLGIWYATVPTGTTASIVMSFSGNPTDCAIDVGIFNSGASTTPTNTQSTTAGSGTMTLNTTIPSSGFAVMAAASQDALTTPSWSNMTAGTGDLAELNGGNCFYTAHSITSGSPTALAITITNAIGHSVSASWGP